jgi:hypothetical protein
MNFLMADWKEMYLNLMQDTEKAIRMLEKSQETCEKIYLRSEDLLVPSPQSETSGKEPQEELRTNE